MYAITIVLDFSLQLLAMHIISRCFAINCRGQDSARSSGERIRHAFNDKMDFNHAEWNMICVSCLYNTISDTVGKYFLMTEVVWHFRP